MLRVHSILLCAYWFSIIFAICILVVTNTPHGKYTRFSHYIYIVLLTGLSVVQIVGHNIGMQLRAILFIAILVLNILLVSISALAIHATEYIGNHTALAIIIANITIPFIGGLLVFYSILVHFVLATI
jgi:hypothetical protein